MESSVPFDPRVLALLREVRLRVLVTAMHLPERRAELVEESAWRDLFGFEDELAVAASVLVRPASVERYLARLRRTPLTAPLAASLEALPSSEERWGTDLAILRAARCFHHVRRATEALLRRQQRALEGWNPQDEDDTTFVAEQLLEDASLLPVHVAEQTRALPLPARAQEVDAAARSIAALHRVHADWSLTASLVERTAARAPWLPSLGEAAYYGLEGAELRYAMLANAVLRELGHPTVTEHPAIVRLVDAAAEWTADACWQNTGDAYVESRELREQTAAELRAMASAQSAELP